MEENSDPDTVELTEEERARIYHPWRNSIILKLFGKKLAHPYLKSKLNDQWKTTEPFSLIDLGHGYYTIKFECPENAMKVAGGPRFVTGGFLSGKK